MRYNRHKPSLTAIAVLASLSGAAAQSLFVPSITPATTSKLPSGVTLRAEDGEVCSIATDPTTCSHNWNARNGFTFAAANLSCAGSPPFGSSTCPSTQTPRCPSYGVSWDNPCWFPTSNDFAFYPSGALAARITSYESFGYNFAQRITGDTAPLSTLASAGMWTWLNTSYGVGDPGPAVPAFDIDEPGPSP